MSRDSSEAGNATRLLFRLDRLGAGLGSLRERSNEAADPRNNPKVLPTFNHACDFSSGCSLKIEKNLSASLGVKDRFAQGGQGIGCRDGRLDRAGSDERHGFT